MKAYKKLARTAPSPQLRKVLSEDCSFVKFSMCLEYYLEWTKIGNVKMCDCSAFEASNSAGAAGLKVRTQGTYVWFKDGYTYTCIRGLNVVCCIN